MGGINPDQNFEQFIRRMKKQQERDNFKPQPRPEWLSVRHALLAGVTDYVVDLPPQMWSHRIVIAGQQPGSGLHTGVFHEKDGADVVTNYFNHLHQTITGTTTNANTAAAATSVPIVLSSTDRYFRTEFDIEAACLPEPTIVEARGVGFNIPVANAHHFMWSNYQLDNKVMDRFHISFLSAFTGRIMVEGRALS